MLHRPHKKHIIEDIVNVDLGLVTRCENMTLRSEVRMLDISRKMLGLDITLRCANVQHFIEMSRVPRPTRIIAVKNS